MYHDSTHWGYIHQKKETEKVTQEKYTLDEENKKLKKIVVKLLNKEKLIKEDLEFLEKQGIKVENPTKQ